ncbi:MAG: hypothetical protein NC339_04825 [Muribaculaceae bacterium]|nr:hypothetical protein [Muribaculaceae bacterium]MCM1293894.1 hypothetical protein [Bacteroides sp.]
MDTDKTVNNKRVAKNSGYLALRMFFVLGVSLYTSRVVLDVLGIDDYGVYNIVGGVVGLMSFFTSSLTNVTQRFFSMSLGQDDVAKTNSYFNQSMILFALICLAIIIFGETVGVWFVNHKLVIPPGLEYDAYWTFQFAMLTVVINILTLPYVSDVIAREHMSFYAYMGIFEVSTRLGMTFLLLIFREYGSASFYTFMLAMLSMLTLIVYMVYCRRHFAETSLRLHWDWKLVKEMVRFVGCNLFGCFAYSIGMQGNDVLLNLYFGTAINAARGISMQVNNALFKFSDAILSAVKPQIIKSYCGGDTNYTIWLLNKTSLYTFLLMLSIAMPIFFNLDLLLGLWLPVVPDYTVSFTRLILIDSMVGMLIAPFWLAVNATGRIFRNQVVGRFFILLTLPVSYLILQLYHDPTIPFIVNILSQVCYLFFSLWDIHEQIKFSYRQYFKEVIMPILLITMSVTSVAAAEYYSIGNSWVMLGVSVVTIPLFTFALAYRFTLTSQIRAQLRLFVKSHLPHY